jgi:hypothetical protein
MMSLAFNLLCGSFLATGVPAAQAGGDMDGNLLIHKDFSEQRTW